MANRDVRFKKGKFSNRLAAVGSRRVMCRCTPSPDIGWPPDARGVNGPGVYVIDVELIW